MNIDFHYYATFFAANLAGYDFNDSEKIAWAAQMVDELTEELAQKLNINPLELTITCQEVSSTLLDEFSTLSKEDNETLKKIRSIWMPFHFLPGNINEEKKYTGRKDWIDEIKESIRDTNGFDRAKEYSGDINWIDTIKKYISAMGGDKYIKYNERDEHDFQLMCLPNSIMVKNMINNAIKEYARSNSLFLLGVTMHVLADTWAHQNFVGSPNYWINSAAKLEITYQYSGEISLIENAGSKLTSWLGSFSSYDINYLGHATIAHLPDYACLEFKYRPRWKKDCIVVDNQERFFKAFCQMVDALKAAKSEKEFMLNNYDKAETIPAEMQMYSEEIKTVLKSTHLDQSEDWRKLIVRYTEEHGISEKLADFSVPNDKEMIKEFSIAAKKHKEFVMKQLEGRI